MGTQFMFNNNSNTKTGFYSHRTQYNWGQTLSNIREISAAKT